MTGQDAGPGRGRPKIDSLAHDASAKLSDSSSRDRDQDARGATDAQLRMFEKYREAGEALAKAKALVPEGQWARWLKQKVGVSRVTAFRYMQWGQCFTVKHGPPTLSEMRAAWRRILSGGGTKKREHVTLEEWAGMDRRKQRRLLDSAKASASGFNKAG